MKLAPPYNPLALLGFEPTPYGIGLYPLWRKVFVKVFLWVKCNLSQLAKLRIHMCESP